MVWACHLTKRWECPITFGRKFLEIYVIRLQKKKKAFDIIFYTIHFDLTAVESIKNMNLFG